MDDCVFINLRYTRLWTIVNTLPWVRTMTAKYVEYSGKTELAFARGNVVLTEPSSTLTTEKLHFDRIKQQRPEIDKLFINSDNGPECSGQRTQWLKRLLQLSRDKKIEIELAYYPPYHSKYNPVERFWGVLENHWRGEIISTINKAIGLAKTMTYNAISPIVNLVGKVYEKGISLTPKQMKKEIEPFLIRKDGLKKYFITIVGDQ